MNVFDLNRTMARDYEAFSRSFVSIAADDLREAVDQAYADHRYTPDPLISMNPRYKPGESVNELVADGTLHPDTGRIFRIDGRPLRLHRHQAQAAASALAGESFVVTTGTGSGKSLCFFLPIIDQAVRLRMAGDRRRTRAIVVYPMNALANSQEEEINKFLRESGLSDPPTVARYTGQESDPERRQVADNPPDVLLTNFVMLELLMTRRDEVGSRVIANCVKGGAKSGHGAAEI